MLNKQKGNMYDWVTHTWNPIKGGCPHGCHYCYMKKWGIKQKPARLVESELKTSLGHGNTIFVGSSCDMWAQTIPRNWIELALDHCNKFGGNTYLFQSKNPKRLGAWLHILPPNVILGTTIESNHFFNEMGLSPHPIERWEAMCFLKELGFKTMITIEPIMAFNDQLIKWILDANPDWVNIGANTNSKVNLTEPSSQDVKRLIDALGGKVEVKKKSNLKRLI
jgi:DNA repair photolyase